MAQGGLRFWKDGRDVPDVMLGMFDYPETAAHPPFSLSCVSTSSTALPQHVPPPGRQRRRDGRGL